MELTQLPLVNNTALHRPRFELHVDGEIAYLEYAPLGDTKLALIHTEVPKALEGKGVASKLIHDVLERAKAGGKKIIPYCPFVQAYLKRHHEYQSIVIEPTNATS